MSASPEISNSPPARFDLDRAARIAFLVVFVPNFFVLLAVALLHLPWLVAMVLPLLLFLGWVVHSPQVGVYALLAVALIVGVQPLGYPESISEMPLWLNLSVRSSLNLPGFGITPVEILMLATLVGVLGRLAVAKTLPPVGRLMWPYLIFGFALFMGEVNGLVRGGEFNLSLWELRPQIYGLAMFVLATLVIRNRSQVKILLAILLVSEAFKAGEGVHRYFLVIGQDLGARLSENLAHDDSYLLGLFLLAIVVGLIWFRKPVILPLLLIAPIVFTAIVVNHRRAGLLELVLEIVVAMAFAYIVEPRLRGALVTVAVVMTVISVAFLVIFWNHQSGSIGEVIRPLKSLVDPTARDLSSDAYRIAESANLVATYRTALLTGIGFGLPYYIFYPQYGVSEVDPLWAIIPHNTVLWIPMRMGLVGLVAFWSLVSMAIIEAIWAVKTVHDKFIRAAVVFALAAVVGVLFNGYVDIGLESYRNMVVVGVMLALISQAIFIAENDRRDQELSATARNRPEHNPRTPTLPIGAAPSPSLP
jgi:hypothetical protein